MLLTELNERLKQLKSKQHEIALFKFLKENSHLILTLQQDQLFRDSEDVWGQPLGFYSYNTTKREGQSHKKGGQPFDMYASGDFFRGLTVKVMNRSIEITSHPQSHLNKMLSNPAFDSTDFFGLTEENLIWLKQQHTGKFMRKWTKRYLQTGETGISV
jgi:hypothetical protein